MKSSFIETRVKKTGNAIHFDAIYINMNKILSNKMLASLFLITHTHQKELQFEYFFAVLRSG